MNRRAHYYRNLIHGVLGLAVSAAVTSGALAQGEPASRSGSGLGIEEILVTAQRREENIQDVPISISAFTGETLKRLGADTTRSLQLFVPGLVIGQIGSAQVTLRGVSTSNLNASGDPGVGVYIDDIYLARASAAFQDFFDTERVEVLRGPQGTLFGRNTPGGVIAIHNTEPDKEFGGYIQSIYGTRNRIRVEGAVTMPVSDALSLRVAAVGENRDGYLRNQFDDKRVADKELSAIRASLKYAPTDSFVALLRADYSKDQGTGNPFKAFTPGLANFIGGFSPIGQDNAVNIDEPLTTDARNKGISLRIDWDISEDWRLTSITGIREHETADTGDLDDTELSTALYDNNGESSTKQQEFQLSTTAIEGLDLIAGVFLWKEDADVKLEFPFPVFGVTPLNISEIETESIAAFAQGTYHVTEKLRLTAGVRITQDEKDFFRDSTLAPFFFNILSTDDRKDKETTPRFGIDYFVSEDVMVYVNATKGFKSGGFNAAGIQPIYEPEFVWAYEGGMKSSLLNNRLQLNLTAFYYDYTDVQSLRIVQAGSAIDNASSGEIQGAEVEITAVPNENLRLFFALSYLDATYEEYLTTDDLTQLPADLSGNYFPRSPKWSFSSSIDYSFAIGDAGKMTLHGDVQFKDDMYFDQFNRDITAEESVTVLNAVVSYEPHDSRWRMSVYGRNLTDEFYAENKFAIAESQGTVLGVVSPPRTFGVEFGFFF